MRFWRNPGFCAVLSVFPVRFLFSSVPDRDPKCSDCARLADIRSFGNSSRSMQPILRRNCERDPRTPLIARHSTQGTHARVSRRPARFSGADTASPPSGCPQATWYARASPHRRSREHPTLPDRQRAAFTTHRPEVGQTFSSGMYYPTK